MAEEEKDVKSEEDAKPGKLNRKLIIIIVAVFVLAAGGFLGRVMIGKEKKDPSSVEESPSSPANEEVRITYPIDSFIVNLMDRQGLGKRYLKATFVLEIDCVESQENIEKSKPRLKDAILLLLSSQSLEEINSMEGKLELKQSLLSKINQILGKQIVSNIYFTEFVVQ